jgi:hypothetical protein
VLDTSNQQTLAHTEGEGDITDAQPLAIYPPTLRLQTAPATGHPLKPSACLHDIRARDRPFPSAHKHLRNFCRKPAIASHTSRALSPTNPSRSTSLRDHAQPTMNSNNGLRAGLVPQDQTDAPVTPQPAHLSIPQGTKDVVSKVQAERVHDATDSTSISLTPPPSAQVSNNTRINKSHTPTPTPSASDSHISTPPPTIDALSQDRPIGSFAHAMTGEQIAGAPADDLRLKVAELQAAYRDAQMSAAHHRLQYQMLAQESAAAIERMAVEARMVQYENEVIHEQARATTAPMLPSPIEDGTIPVQKNLYQRMCRDIQQLSETNNFLEAEHRMQEKLIFRQDNEIAGLTDKVAMLRDRIREHRDHQNRVRGANFGGYLDSASQSVIGTPRRMTAREQAQPFAALLQASAMAREEVGASKPTANRLLNKKGHSRNTQSLSSLPATPNRARKQPPLFQTPQVNPNFRAMPSTAPVPRMSNIRNPEFYTQQKPSLKRMQDDLGSDGTVSASDHEVDDQDSEAETEILEPNEIDESRASFSAAQMLRANPGPTSQPAEHNFRPAKGGLRQGKLFGAVKKSNTVRAGEDEPPAKKARTIQGIGLGIKGVSHR